MDPDLAISGLVSQLAETELFACLTPDERASIAALGRVEHWRADAVLMQEDTRCPRLLVVLDGLALVLVRDASGVERPIARVGRGEALGEIGLLLDRPRTATVRALSPVSALAIDATAFRERLAASDLAALKLGVALSRTLAGRLVALNARVSELLSERGSAPAVEAREDRVEGDVGDAVQSR